MKREYMQAKRCRFGGQYQDKLSASQLVQKGILSSRLTAAMYVHALTFAFSWCKRSSIGCRKKKGSFLFTPSCGDTPTLWIQLRISTRLAANEGWLLPTLVLAFARGESNIVMGSSTALDIRNLLAYAQAQLFRFRYE